MNLFDEPPEEPFSDTSREAWESIKDHEHLIRMKVYRFICNRKEDGATSDEIEVVLDMPHQTCSSAITRLKKVGWVADSGRRRKTRQGRNAAVIVCKPTQTGGTK